MKKLVDIGDKTAIALSILCTLHCIVTPIVLVILPSVTTILAFDIELLHIWLLFAVIPISIFAMVSGYFHHRKASISAISVVGLCLLILAVTLGHDLGNAWAEPLMTVLGSLLIAYSHIKSLSLRKNKQYTEAFVS